MVKRKTSAFGVYAGILAVTSIGGLFFNLILIDLDSLTILFLSLLVSSMLILNFYNPFVEKGCIIFTNEGIIIDKSMFELSKVKKLSVRLNEYKGQKRLGNLRSFSTHDGTDNFIEFEYNSKMFHFQFILDLEKKKSLEKYFQDYNFRFK